MVDVLKINVDGQDIFLAGQINIAITGVFYIIKDVASKASELVMTGDTCKIKDGVCRIWSKIERRPINVRVEYLGVAS